MATPKSRRKLAAILSSDVVGYSRLMREDDVATIAAVVATRKLMARHIGRHAGRVVDAPGDALLAEFESAVEAVRCAVSIQQGMLRRNAEVPVNRQMRVRIGLNLGDVIERDAALYGEGVNVAARLQALGRPDGICISGAIHEQIENRLALQMSFAGEHHVKNIATPVRVFHITVDEAASVGPAAPATTELEAGRSLSNVPSSMAPLIGRDKDVRAVLAELAEHRLITLLGAGGIGKTRLAQTIAKGVIDRYPDGVWWVDLSAVSVGAEIAPAIAKAVQLQLGEGDPAAMLTQALAPRELMLVLDNCEHLAGEVAQLVQRSLHAAPRLRVLATSQEPLKLGDEWLYRLDPLACPAPGTPLESARQFGAIQLLEVRARSVDHDFALDGATVDAAIEICRQLDGLALAIEMAASRIPMLGLLALKSMLGDRLQLLKSGARSAPSRQQTLRATLDWSHALLSPECRAVLRRLSVFAGSFRLDTAQQVGSDIGLDAWGCLDALSALVERSLLQVEQAEPPRYRLLETTRLYALERLAEAQETDAAWQSHGRAMRAVAMAAVDAHWLLSDDETLRRYRPDDQDLQIAFERACECADVGVVAATGAAFRILSQQRSPHAVGQRRKVAAYALMPLAPPAERARHWHWLANFHSSGVPGLPRLAASRESLQASREVGDSRMVYQALWVLAVELAQGALWEEAEACVIEARSAEVPDWPPRLRAVGSMHQATLHMFRADAAAFRRETVHCIALCERAGAVRTAAWQRHNIADAALMAGEFDEAVRLEQAAIEELAALKEDRRLCWALANLCAAHLLADDNVSATHAARQALQHMHRMTMQGDLYDHLALVAARSGNCTEAALMLGASDAWYQRTQRSRQPNEQRLAERVEQALAANIAALEDIDLRLAGGRLDDTAAIALAYRVLDRN